MFRRFIALAALFALAAAPAPPKLSSKPIGTEIAFVKGIQKDLNARFPTPTEAEKAGYFRYTNEDNTGAISYANNEWQSSDPQHPCQLWYSVGGKLLGADYCVSAANSPKPPSLWGVKPGRWQDFEAHIHYVLTLPDGKEKYGGAHLAKFVAAGGDANSPQAETLVKMGIAKDTASVKHVFLFPHVWDLIVWVMDNPDGAFAERNPSVKPTTKTPDSM